MKKREFTAEYKAKIVAEMLKEEEMVSEIASREGTLMKKSVNLQ